MQRTFVGYRSATWKLAMIAIVGLLLTACDGSLTVSGQLEAENCGLSLWALRGPVWAEPKPTKLREATVGDAFDIHWTISGPQTEHWVEVACVGYRTFRSPTFQAPSTIPTLRLGKVKLERLREPSPPSE